MTKKELVTLNGILIKLSGFGKTKFKYSVLKNIEMLKSAISVLVDIENEIKKFAEPFNEDRNSLILKIGKKNDDGSVYIDVTDEAQIKLFNQELEILLTKHEKDLRNYGLKMAEYQEILLEELDEIFTFKIIALDQFPDEDVSIDDLMILEKFKIIEEV